MCMNTTFSYLGRAKYQQQVTTLKSKISTQTTVSRCMMPAISVLYQVFHFITTQFSLFSTVTIYFLLLLTQLTLFICFASLCTEELCVSDTFSFSYSRFFLSQMASGQIIGAHGTDGSIGIPLLSGETFLQEKNSTGRRWDLNPGPCRQHDHCGERANHCATLPY